MKKMKGRQVVKEGAKKSDPLIQISDIVQSKKWAIFILLCFTHLTKVCESQMCWIIF